MLLYINETPLESGVENNRVLIMPYISTYRDNPLNNFKNAFNSSVSYSPLLTSDYYAPSVKGSVCVPVNFINETTIGYVPGKVNHTPVADFITSVNNGVLSITNTSFDEDGDALTYKWRISDDILFSTRNVVYELQNSGSHTISLTVNDGEMSNTKTATIIANGADSTSEAIFIDFTLEQSGNSFTATDISTTRNVYEYDRTWYLDGIKLSNTTSTVSGTVLAGRHTLRLECSAGNFRGHIDKNIYYNAEAIISVKTVTIPRGSSITLTSTNSITDGDPITGIEWSTMGAGTSTNGGSQ
jgi:PKD repeat protein